MPDLVLFLVLWLAMLLAGEHVLADREIVLGDGLPEAVAWSVRCAYLVGTGAVAFVLLGLLVAAAPAPL
jgi:hypothetical protein